jgi:hypothetical protein
MVSALASYDAEVSGRPYQFVMTDAAANNSLAQSDKSSDGDDRHLGSVRPSVWQSGEGPNSTFEPLCLTCPGQHVSPCGRGLFLSMASTNKSLAQINKSPKVAAAFVQKMHVDQQTP